VTAAYDALLASATPDFVVLAEVQPMERLNSWTAAGGGLTNTYYAAFSTQIATTIVAGGIYRRLDSVRQNATALTLRASSALVDANLGSYFHDTATNRLYVSTTSGVSPDALAIVGAWFTLFLTSTSVSLSGQPLYTPIITDGLPTMTDEMPDTLFGAAFSASGPLTVLNGDGLFDRLSKQYVWRNKLVTFKLGGGSLAYSDFATIDTLRINAITADDEHCTLQLEGLGNILNQSLPLKTWGDGTLFNAPNPAQAADGIDGISQPLVFGQVADCPCVLGGRNGIAGADYWYAFDSNGGTYGICIVTGVYAVNRTTQARTLLVGGGIDYAVSGANIQVINATYFYESYDIICTLTQLATIGSPKFGTMARAILEICGESTANIDTAAFTAADTAAPQVLARYIGERRHGGRPDARTGAVRQRASLQGLGWPLDLSHHHPGPARVDRRHQRRGFCDVDPHRGSPHDAERSAGPVCERAARRRLDRGPPRPMTPCSTAPRRAMHTVSRLG
jgi:hypothetical protein